ncbi:MAG TPA: glutathione S-transferase family protein [Paraburkholderia sp.]|nr:glutathione S-transferase family protein [Paraburkholderia sp.]
MGLLVNGQWQDRWYDTASTGGRFVRKDAAFRNWVTADGSAGPSGRGGFEAEAGRYHLYVSLACPWAHRTLVVRALKGLQEMISVSSVHWLMLEHGWTFADGPGVVPDTINGARLLHQVYTAAAPDYTGRVTVPVLWDKRQATIVSNESSEIIRMLNSAFDGLGAQPGDFFPAALRTQIEEINARVYDTLNNGVYKAGFATTQRAYEEAVTPLFETLDWLDAWLATRRFLTGDTFTEADIRLFTTLIRFDAVYVGHFKCNLRRIADYPNLSAYTRDIYQLPDVAGTVNFEHIKRHYYESHRGVNPTSIVPLCPVLDFAAPHDRARLTRSAPPLPSAAM